jgi:hypothetical protein
MFSLTDIKIVVSEDKAVLSRHLKGRNSLLTRVTGRIMKFCREMQFGSYVTSQHKNTTTLSSNSNLIVFSRLVSKH